MSSPVPEGPIAEVDRENLQRVWNFLKDLQSKHGGNFGVDPRVLESVCVRPDNSMSLWLRSSVLMMLDTRSFLDKWKVDGHLADRVFQVAATWKIADIQQLRPEEFLQALDAESE